MSSEPKTRPTGASVDDFIASVDHPGRREDAKLAVQLLREITGWEPEMWGPSIVGFGRYYYDDPRGKPQEWPAMGFSPRKANMVFYLTPGYETKRPDLMERLGKYKLGASCLYLGRLSDVDMDALRELSEWSLATTKAKYRTGP